MATSRRLTEAAARRPWLAIIALVCITLLLATGLLLITSNKTTPAPSPSPTVGASTAPSLEPTLTSDPSPTPTCTSPTTSPSVAPETSPSESQNPREADGVGDRCSYISVYVHSGDEHSSLDTNAKLTAVRISVDGDPLAPSISVEGVPLFDGGYSFPEVTSGATWRILLNGRRIFDRDASRLAEQIGVCSELVLHVARGSTTRFVLFVARTSTIVNCPGAVATYDSSLKITPDVPPPSPPPQLNAVRFGREIGQLLRYRPELIDYLRSLEETNSGTSIFAVLLFVIGTGGMLAFASFAVWLKFGTHELGQIRRQQHPRQKTKIKVDS